MKTTMQDTIDLVSKTVGIEKNLVAFIVLYNVLSLLHKTEREVLNIVEYSNGREEGFTLYIRESNTITFSENRNSDDVVVYQNFVNFGSRQVFNDEAYTPRKYFHGNDVGFGLAAEYIVNKLRGN